jgi:hypothetical protein
MILLGRYFLLALSDRTNRTGGVSDERKRCIEILLEIIRKLIHLISEPEPSSDGDANRHARGGFLGGDGSFFTLKLNECAITAASDWTVRS